MTTHHLHVPLMAWLALAGACAATDGPKNADALEAGGGGTGGAAALSEEPRADAGSPTGDAGPTSPGDPSQVPPQGKASLDPWLEAGHYRSWRCEQDIMDSRPKGAHGRNRVCSNDRLSGAAAPPFPVGSAAVKEIFGSDDTLTGIAVAVKVAAGTGASSWYWYERLGGSTVADGVEVGLCSGCHATAPADNIFVQVK
jgi:hypothetical protein